MHFHVSKLKNKLNFAILLRLSIKPAITEPLSKTKVKTHKPFIKSTKPAEVEIAEIKEQINKPKTTDFNKIFATNFIKKPVIENPFSSEKLGVSPSKIVAWETDTLNLRKGLDYLDVKKTQNAITEFQKLTFSKFLNIKSHADWYLVLAYIQEKDIINAKKQLTTIAENDEHNYSKRAKTLIKLLK